MSHGQGSVYVATIPPHTVRLFRLMSGPRADGPQFVSNQRLERMRAWPGRGEDILMYQGISAYEDRGRAASMAGRVNESLERKGKPPRWTHIAEFLVDGHAGVVYAKTRSDGHFSVWGEPELLASSVGAIEPISG
jgi:hypothetical protein